MRVAIVGAGRWGVNHVRAFARIGLQGGPCEVRAVCDPSEEARARAKKLVPQARLEERYDSVLAAPDIDAVVLATPAKDHASMAVQAFAAGKHALVEKPLALDKEGAESVVAAAQRAGRTLMIGHLMLFHPAVQRMREGILAGEIGDILYLYSVRVNLGTLRQDENAMWSLAPHDLSVMLHLLDERPVSVAARGAACLRPDVHDVVFLSLRFASGVLAQIQTSWLDPRKQRRLVVVGKKKMMELDDVLPTEKLRVHDKGFERDATFTEYVEFMSIRRGDILVPEVPMVEPLDVECRHFLECAIEGKRPLTDGASAVRVVEVLTAAQRSLESDGVPITL